MEKETKIYRLTGTRLFWICFVVWIVGVVIGFSNGVVFGAVKFSVPTATSANK